VTENRIGIYVYYSDANVLQYNRVESNLKNGIWLWFSSNNLLEGNEILNNAFNFGVSAPNGGFSYFNNQIDRSNIVNGKPIDYRIDVKNEIIDNMTEVGVLYLINCFNITIQGLELTNNRHGLFGYNITKSTIQHLKTSENSYGIYLQNSRGNIIQENEGVKNWVGIQLYNAINDTIRDNIAGDSEKGISLYEADNNNIVENDISNCLYGIRFYSSHKNTIVHNNLINNTHQADLIISHQNTWDNGFEGNFWSEYSGPDANRDGIGDTSYIIVNGTTTYQDRHPLLGRLHNFSIYDQASHNWVSVITNSTILNFDFEATNNTIMLRVNGTDGTYGFCRVSIPHVIVEPEIIVVIDNGLTETLHPDYFIHDDDTRRWIYFAYQQSTHEIVIIPEFGVAILLLIATFLTIFTLVLKRTAKN
jgi:parallel beta-helix repeat protein